MTIKYLDIHKSSQREPEGEKKYDQVLLVLEFIGGSSAWRMDIDSKASIKGMMPYETELSCRRTQDQNSDELRKEVSIVKPFKF